MNPQTEELRRNLVRSHMRFTEGLSEALNHLSQTVLSETQSPDDLSQLPTSLRLLAEGLYVKYFAEWERFIRLAIATYFEAVTQQINEKPSVSAYSLPTPLMFYALQSKYQLVSKNQFKDDQLLGVISLKNDLSLHPIELKLEEDDKMGSMLTVDKIKQRLLLLGCDHSRFDPGKINLPDISPYTYAVFVEKRDRLAHGKDAALTYDDLKRLTALLSDLAYQLIDILADAFEKRQFATQ